MNNKTQKTAIAALFCAMVFIFTWLSFPTPIVGNINLGDCMILLCACLLGGPYAAVAGALGAALCDLVNGYAFYAPGTFVIKALMVVVFLLIKKYIFKGDSIASMIVPGICAEQVMIAGYFAYECFVLGFGTGAMINIPINALQGAVSMAAATALFGVMKKSSILHMIRVGRQR